MTVAASSNMTFSTTIHFKEFQGAPEVRPTSIALEYLYNISDPAQSTFFFNPQLGFAPGKTVFRNPFYNGDSFVTTKTLTLPKVVDDLFKSTFNSPVNVDFTLALTLYGDGKFRDRDEDSNVLFFDFPMHDIVRSWDDFKLELDLSSTLVSNIETKTAEEIYQFTAKLIS